MPIEVRLPELAESMTSATLTGWLKKVGDRVTAGWHFSDTAIIVVDDDPL